MGRLIAEKEGAALLSAKNMVNIRYKDMAGHWEADVRLP